MPSKRPPPKRNPKGTAAAPLDTADAFLAQGVAHEESAEKWRAGDAAKAARFYAKALDAYAAGLSAFPGVFDLQYNAARAQFTITQYPAVAAQFPGSVGEQIQVALDGHRAALALEGGRGNADVLFNTAQVLRSFAEVVDDGDDDDGDLRGLEMLEEALRHLATCLDVQERKLEARKEDEMEAARQLAQAQRDGFTTDALGTADDGETETATDDGHAEDESGDAQKWAFIEEPVTVATVLDTCVAIADTLIAACEAAAARGLRDKLQGIESAATTFLHQRAQAYIDSAEASERVEVCTARAKTKVALLAAAYVFGSVDLDTYDAGITAAFEAETAFVAATDPTFLCAQAEALTDFVDTAAQTGAPPAKRWTRLEKALNMFSTAAKETQEPADQSQIHISRGDVELLRLGVTLDAAAPASLQGESVRRTLVQNAQKFYRAARASVRGDLSGAAQDNDKTAQAKEAIAAAAEAQSSQPIKALQQSGQVTQQVVRETLDDMVQASLLPDAVLRSIGF